MTAKIIKLYPEPQYEDDTVKVVFTEGVSVTRYKSGSSSYWRRMLVTNKSDSPFICARSYRSSSALHFIKEKTVEPDEIDIEYGYSYNKEYENITNGTVEMYMLTVAEKKLKNYLPQFFHTLDDHLSVSPLYRFEFDIGCFTGKEKSIIF